MRGHAREALERSVPFQFGSTWGNHNTGRDHTGRASVEGRSNVPSTTSTKFLSSRRINRLLCAMAKFSPRAGINLKAPLEALKGAKFIKSNKPQSHIFRPFVGKKIPDR